MRPSALLCPPFQLKWMILLICFGCQSRNLSPEEFRKWVEDESNGVHVSRNLGEYEIKVQYHPIEYQRIVSPELVNGDQSDLQYYTLKIRPRSGELIEYGASNLAQKQQRLYHFSYTFQNLISLEEDGIRFPCVLYHFESSVDSENYRTFLLGFERPKRESNSSKIILESDVISALPVIVKISKADIPSVAL